MTNSSTMARSLVVCTLLATSTLSANTPSQDLGSITIISASNTPQTLNQITANASVVTAMEIEERGYTTVAQAINSLAGISLVSNGGLGQTTSVYMRGMDSKHILVLIDGVRVNDVTGLSGAPFADVMLSDVARIEVIKGAQSGVWGADASAGVINIISKSAQIGTHGSLYAEAGSYSTKKVAATLSHKAENFYIKLATSVVDTDGFSSQSPKGEAVENYENDGYTNTTATLKAGYSFDSNNKIDISHTMIESEGDYDTFDDPNGIAESKTNDSFSFINFHHIDSFNELDVYIKQSTFDREYTGDYEYDGDIIEYGVKSKIVYNESDFLLVGAEYKESTHENELNSQYDSQALFLTNVNTFNGFIGGKTILTESIRIDTYSDFENKVTGKIGFKHFVEEIEGLVASANYGTAYTAPTLYQLYAPAGDWGPIGNSELTPESIQSLDVSIAYEGFSVTYFNNEIEDMIGFRDGYVNIDGTSTIKGYELEYQGEVIDDTLVTLAYTWLDAQDIDGKELGGRPKESLKFAVDYYGIESLHFGLNGQYVGKRVEYDYLGDFKAQTGKYTVVNLVANYDIRPDIKLSMRIENLTDELYQMIDGYATPARSAYVGIKASF